METFQKAVEHEFSAVNQLIVDRLQSDVGLVESIGHYIVEAGGKRLRPLVVLLMRWPMAIRKLIILRWLR